MSNFNNVRFDNSTYQPRTRTYGWGAGSYRQQNGYMGGPAYNSGNVSTKPKHTGARTGNGSNGVPFITGWNKSRKGFLSFVACPAKEPDFALSKDGKGKKLKTGWKRWVASMTFKPSDNYKAKKSTATAFYNEATRKLYIPEFSMVANPSAPRGGYFGQSRKPKR